MSNFSRPLVTIGIPTYNRAAKKLRSALQCAVSQTYGNLEIVVSDNCSTDNTEEVVSSFADPRIRYIRQAENIGAHNNFNFCVKEARGAYFLLFHDDDLIDADFVEACMNAVDDDITLGIIRTGTRLIDGEGKVLDAYPNNGAGLSTLDFFFGWMEGKFALYLCSTLFNTRRLQDMGGFHSKTHLFQDVVAQMILAAKYGHGNVYDVKASFRRHEENRGSAAKLTDWCLDSLYLIETMVELAPERKDELRRAAMKYLSRFNYYLAAKIESPIERLRAYAMIDRMFERNYPMLRFMYNRSVAPRLNHWRKMVFGKK